MAKKIEILENTLLKLLTRRGDDLDRQNIILSEGELGYTTDGKRLFVGDGQTLGGSVVGNIYKGSVADHTTVSDAIEGDIVFNNTSNIIYFKTDTSWLSASQILEAGDDTISINAGAGTITVGTLSASNFSADIVGNSIELVSGRISLSSTQIKTDQINTSSATHLKLPGDLNINSVDYTFPVGGLGSNQVFLGADANGDLHWRTPDKSSTFYFNSSAAAIPVGTVVAAASGASMPTGWLICDGQSIGVPSYGDLHDVIGYQYGGSGSAFNIPDYTNTVHVGTAVPSTFTNGTLAVSGAGDYTTKGVVYFIKAEADGVVTTTLTVTPGLTASKDGVPQTSSFSILDGDIEIGIPTPGIEVFDKAATSTFTTKATFTKFWVTGSGATGGSVSGGSAATIMGTISAPVGTVLDYTVGAGKTTSRTNGEDSFIGINAGAELARSFGARAPARDTWAGILTSNGGSFAPTDAHVLSVHMLSGAWGGMDCNEGEEETHGNASFWGGAGAPGASGHSVGSNSYGYTADGIVKFEWGL